MSETTATSVLRQAVLRVLRPLVRILLRNSVACADSIELLKQAYVDVAMREFQVPGRKPTVSRTAVITGLTRKEVQRLAKGPELREEDVPRNRAARVVAGWVRDPDFNTTDSEPNALSVEGAFAELVRRYSGDMPPRAVLDELARVGVVEEIETGQVRLLTRSYVPARDDTAKLRMLGTDVAELVATIDHNLSASAPARYQRKVRYDNIPVDQIARLRPEIADRCQRLLEELDDLLAAHDRDTNPEIEGVGRGVAGVGIYYFEEQPRETPEARTT